MVSIYVSILIEYDNNGNHTEIIKKGFTFDLGENKELKFDDLFDLRCINDLNIIQIDNFVLTKNAVKLIYDDGSIKNISYKKLKEYNTSNLLTSEN